MSGRSSRGATGERVAPAAAVAVVLAVAGVLAAVVRPTADVPAAATELTRFSSEVLEVSGAYHRPRDVGAAVSVLLRVAVPLSVILTPYGRRLLRRVAGADGAWWRGGLVAGAVAVASSVARLPVAVWLGYLHDTRWGFNTAGLAGWARDWLLSAGIGWGIAAVGGAVLLAAVVRWPASWHWRMVAIGTVLTAVLALAHPLIVAPLFYRTEPLPPGPVRTEVEQVLAAAGQPDASILVGDASRRTTRINAFVTGLGPSREVILFDTLLSLPADRVGLIVAHELAHREHRDVARSVLLGAAGLLVGLVVLRRLWDAPGLRRLVAARSGRDPRLVAVAVAVAVAVELALQPAAMTVSRRAEAAADARAMALTDDPAALVRTARLFTVRDLARPTPPAPVQILWGTHPTVRRRIEAAAGYARSRDLDLPALSTVRRAERPRRHEAVPGGIP